MELLHAHATLYVLLIAFAATLVRSTFGFGEGLIAVPLLALFIPIQVATPLVSLLSVTVGGIAILQDWRKVHFRSATWLIGASVLGIPLGLLLLKSNYPRAVKAVLALTIIGFSFYSLLGSKRRVLERDDKRLLLLFGFAAGILGGAYGMNGPPLAIYGTMRRWSAMQFRATLQAYFLPASLIGLIGYYLAGLWVPAVTQYYLLSLPIALPAIFLGRFMNRCLGDSVFVKYVYIGLIATGFFLVIECFGAGL